MSDWQVIAGGKLQSGWVFFDTATPAGRSCQFSQEANAG